MQRTNRILVFSLLTAFFLFSCGGGGGGGESSAPPAPQTPSATTVAASPVTTDNATLNGSVNPNGLATTAWFEWGVDNTLASPTVTAPQSAGSGSADNVISQKITGLTPGTTYYYRVVANNSAGTVKGLIVSCTTAAPLSPPAASTFAVTNKTITGATLNGSVIPNGQATDAWFVWGPDPLLLNPSTTQTTAHQAKGSGMTDVQVSESITGLAAASTYYFKIVAQNAVGTANGDIGNFTTNTVAPSVTTSPATLITASGATLNGSVNPNGLATTAWFEWGTDSGLASFSSTSSQNMGSGLTSSAMTPAAITGLSVGTTYYFRVAASNSGGTTKGTDIKPFVTDNPPPTANAGSDQSVYILGAAGRTEVTLDGSGSSAPNGKTITTYLWEQVDSTGLSAPLTGADTASPTFTAPVFNYPADGASKNLIFKLTVTDNTGLTASDNVTVNVKWAFKDDFSTDTTSNYTVEQTWGTEGTFSVQSGFARATTGVANGVLFKKFFGFDGSIGFPRPFAGVFSLNVEKTADHTGAGGIEIRFGESDNTCYLFSTIEGVFRKSISGVSVAEVALPAAYTTGAPSSYWLKFTFDPENSIMRIESPGRSTVDAPANSANVPVEAFFISTVEQNVNYDNIVLEGIY